MNNCTTCDCDPELYYNSCDCDWTLYEEDINVNIFHKLSEVSS